MAEYKISGIWKDDDGVITHYAIHSGPTKRGIKTTKSDAIKLLETTGNTAITWLWNYKTANWAEGENIHVVHSLNGKYLRSNPDNKLTDNLSHLIDFDWLKL